MQLPKRSKIEMRSMTALPYMDRAAVDSFLTSYFIVVVANGSPSSKCTFRGLIRTTAILVVTF